jgi:Histidine kinase-, DNA gyrase B-, and HSP90-like ATPase
MAKTKSLDALPTEGVVEYTGRAAGQDIHEFLQGDVTRALVELITNSDDAYRRNHRSGSIVIKVEHVRRAAHNRVIVQDQAGGMTRTEIHERLLRAGAEASGHAEGMEVRGLHGRGAKDVAGFGRAEFETIKDGQYCKVVLYPDFQFKILDDRIARSSDFQNLDVPPGGGGLKVTIFVERPRFSVPRHQSLATSLSRHFQLRDILRSQKNLMRLVDLTNPQTPPETLRYAPPYELTLLEDQDFEFSVPGYPEARSRLRFWRSEQPLPDLRTPQRDGGILVVGRYGIHDCTYFSFEGRLGALWFVGRLECPFIDTLQHSYDRALSGKAKHDQANPFPIISRRRDGLSRAHPFFKALKEAVEQRFEPLVTEEEDKEGARGGRSSEENRRRLKEAARELAALYRDAAREQELEVRDDGGDEDSISSKAVALEVVPGLHKIPPEESRTFSIRAWSSEWEEGAVPNPEAPVVHMRVENPEVATVTPSELTLAPDPKTPGKWRGTARVTALTAIDATLLEARLGRYDDTAVVEVIETDPQPPSAPERLQFDHDSYRLRRVGTRSLVLMAPTALVDSQLARIATLRANTDELECPSTTEFELVRLDGASWYEALFEVRAPKPRDDRSGTIRLRADIGGQVAICRINVADDEDHTPFDFEVVDRAPRYETAGRAEWAFPHGKKKLLIYAQHPALMRYFGDRLRRQDSILCRALIAEILAEELAIDLLLKRDQLPGAGRLDAHAYDSQRRKWMARFLPVAHRTLLPDQEVV